MFLFFIPFSFVVGSHPHDSLVAGKRAHDLTVSALVRAMVFRDELDDVISSPFLSLSITSDYYY